MNVSGTADGAASYDSSQTYWYQPFNTSGSLLEYTVQPGTYNFRIIDPTYAASTFNLSSSALNQIYTAWTFNSPWATDYLVFDSSAATNSSEYQLFTGATSPTTVDYGSASQAYSGAIADGHYDQIVAGVGGRYNGTVETSYTFTSAETLIFAVPDYYLADNGGGVSVLISGVGSTAPSSTPEPASCLLILGGLSTLSIGRVRKILCSR